MLNTLSVQQRIKQQARDFSSIHSHVLYLFILVGKKDCVVLWVIEEEDRSPASVWET